MATKLEYETKIQQLEARIKLLDPERAKAQDARIAELESELDLGREANGKLNVLLRKAEDALVPLRTEREQLKQALADVTAGSNEQARELVSARSQVRELQEEVRSLRDRCERLDAARAMEGDFAMLDGSPFRVTGRHIAKWLNQEVLRRYVAEDATVVVLDRKGE